MFFTIAVQTPKLACGVLHTVDLYLITEIYVMYLSSDPEGFIRFLTSITSVSEAMCGNTICKAHFP
jgi:hypothetical protein